MKVQIELSYYYKANVRLFIYLYLLKIMLNAPEWVIF